MNGKQSLERTQCPPLVSVENCRDSDYWAN